MAARDLRGWIAQLEAAGELKRITCAVDWDDEVAEIIRRANKVAGPALLFENIKDHERTFSNKLFTNGFGTLERINMLLGLPAGAPPSMQVATVRQRLSAPVLPRRVATGPVKEHVIRAGDIDLFQIPVPRWHPLDGGRYINTYCGVVTRDPDTGVQNVGIYRGMILSRNEIVSSLIPSRDWGLVFEKYQRRGEPMPVAMFYGADPALLLVAGAPVVGPEYDLAGGLTGEAVELVRCEMSDIEVPAGAEIVLEGTISTDPATFRMEGPFGEAGGRYSEPALRPVMTVRCITHRTDPIYQGAMCGLGPGVIGEIAHVWYLMMSVTLWNVLEASGIPGVLDISVTPVAVIKIHKTYQGQARQIAAALWGSKYGGELLKTIVVVEEDVDIHNPAALIGAVQRNTNYDRGLVVYPLMYGSMIDDSLSGEHRNELRYGSAIGSTLLVDATTDWELHPRRADLGGQRHPPSSISSRPETVDRVARRWSELGL